MLCDGLLLFFVYSLFLYSKGWRVIVYWYLGFSSKVYVMFVGSIFNFNKLLFIFFFC